MAAAVEHTKSEATIETRPSITSLDFSDANNWQLGSSLVEVHPALRRTPTDGYKIIAEEKELEKPATPSDIESTEEPLTPPTTDVMLPADLGDSDKIAVLVDTEGSGLIPVPTESLDWATPAPLFSPNDVDLKLAHNDSPFNQYLITPKTAVNFPLPKREDTRVYRPSLHSIPSQTIPLPQLPHQRSINHVTNKMSNLTMASQPSLVEAPVPENEIQPDSTYSSYFPDTELTRTRSRSSHSFSNTRSHSRSTSRPSFSYSNLPDTINNLSATPRSSSKRSSIDLHLQSYASKRQSKGFTIRLKSFSRHGSCLIQAAKVGDFAETLRRLTADSGRAELSATDRDGYTALHHAAAQGHSDIARALLLRNADVEACTKKHHRTPLYLAAENGYVDVVEVLLAARANTNRGSKEDGVTPLHIAAKRGHLRIMELLICAGADVNRLDLAFVSPLIYSMRGHKTAAARILVFHGADVELRMRLSVKPKFGSGEGLTALHYAVEMGNHIFAKLFLELGADPNSDAQGGERALHRAAAKGDAQMVMILLERKAKIMARTNELWTPLHSAAKTGQKRVCHILLQAGAQLNATNNKRQTPKQIARANGFPDCFVKEGRRTAW